jgi:hypothetical protein
MIINNNDTILQLQNYIKNWRSEFFFWMKWLVIKDLNEEIKNPCKSPLNDLATLMKSA